ncbi:MAG: hypothetical protein H6662_13845 [Ardenticatenaceae bacterium]|nr:hypothetical protein [Anaerolineales bacterium]MCB8922664.1 hypothetical protein [Ardenticatenaceae bacterium]MCB9003628.1 hypothetical protein [Ardenticatenaceae bacterium]
MKKSLWILLALTLLIALTACGSATNTPQNNTPNQTNTAPTNMESPADAPLEAPADSPTRPTVTPATANTSGPDNAQDSYPAPQPPAAAPADGYPMVVLSLPNPATYPLASGYVWMTLATGEQCKASPQISLPAAVQALQAVGVNVQSEHSINFAVCQSCGCPESLHYRAQIAEDGVSAAEALGWQVIEP